MDYVWVEVEDVDKREGGNSSFAGVNNPGADQEKDMSKSNRAALWRQLLSGRLGARAHKRKKTRWILVPVANMNAWRSLAGRDGVPLGQKAQVGDFVAKGLAAVGAAGLFSTLAQRNGTAFLPENTMDRALKSKLALFEEFVLKPIELGTDGTLQLSQKYPDAVNNFIPPGAKPLTGSAVNRSDFTPDDREVA